ncbi:MAG: VOC family protein [Planctomycetota bacterium]
MRLGNFSISLTVKDIGASVAFYEKLGFAKVGGNQAQKWVVMQNESSTIGLFQGMIPKNTLTFNPGWDKDKATPADFQDIRDIQKALKARGVKIEDPLIDEASTGTAYLMIMDPDGNPILLDQHVPAPKR